eukprot:jgi/Ulvmu1/3611/UM017_0023.1
MKGFLSRVQKQAYDSANVIFRNSGQNTPGEGAGQTSDQNDDGLLNEALEQALNTRSMGIRNHFASLSPESYSETHELRICTSTFNVNGEKPKPDHDYRSWLMHPGEKWPPRSDQTASWEGPDILFVGFQEINALNAVTVVAGGGLDTVKAWNTAIDCALNCKPLPKEYIATQEAIEALTNGFMGVPDDSTTESPTAAQAGPKSTASGAPSEGGPVLGFGVQQLKEDPVDAEQYVNVGGRLMVGLFLTVWVRKPLLPYISAWQDSEVRTGKMGFGNKGAVLVRLRVFDEPVAAVCAHLASGETPADALKRQADFIQICRSGTFGNAANEGQTILHEPLEMDTRRGVWTRSALAAKQPSVFFLGDLNFRLRLPDAEVRALLRAGALERLLARDELLPALGSADGVFAGWREGAISFPPTFKFAKGTDRYIGEPFPGAEGDEDAQPGASQGLSVATGGGGTPRAANGCADGSPTKASGSATPADASTPAAAATPEGKPVAAHVVVLSDEDEDDDVDKHGVNDPPTLQRDSSAQQSAAFELDVTEGAGPGSSASTGGAFADTAAATPTPSSTTPCPRTPAALGERTSSFQFSRQGSTLVRASSSVGPVAATASRERARAPAWTDRVLYACDSDKLHQLLYDRVEGIALSDHKPVLAAFLLDAVRLDEVRMRRETEAAQRALDALVNSTQPRCELAENLLDVGELGYGEVAERRCSLSCCGEVPAEWMLECPPAARAAVDGGDASGGAAAMPPWIQAHPTKGILSPGQSIDITFRIGVAEASALGDPTTAQHVVSRSDAPCSLGQLFVVHIANGADHFIAVDGTYRPSFFGLTLGTIAAREKAAAKAAAKAEKELEAARQRAADGGDEGGVAEAEAAVTAAAAAAVVQECHCGGEGMSYIGSSPFAVAQWAVIPQPLKKMLHFLARDDSLVTAGIFAESFQIIRSEALAEEGAAAAETAGQLTAVRAVQVALDAGQPIPPTATAHDVAATMLSYFKALPRPFFPDSISTLCSMARPDANKAASTLKEALGGPGVEWATLCCVMRLLKLVIKAQAATAAAASVDSSDGGRGSNVGDSPARAASSGDGTPRSAGQLRQALRSQLAACFSDLWFPAISLQDLDENATADDYAALLQKAADASARQAQFLQMFLV